MHTSSFRSSYTPGNLVRGSCWLCTQNLYANFRPWLTRHSNVNKRVSSPDLLIFRQFHRHILKNQTVLFPATSVSTPEKIRVGYFFLFQFHPEMGSPVFLFWLLLQCNFQLSGLWNTYLTYQIRRTATYVYVEIHKMLNFLSLCSGVWNIYAEYDLRGRLPLTGALTLTRTRKPTVRYLITRPDYPLWEH